jgi:hypothetical protein
VTKKWRSRISIKVGGALQLNPVNSAFICFNLDPDKRAFVTWTNSR